MSFSLLDSQVGGHEVDFCMGVEARGGGELDGWAASKETLSSCSHGWFRGWCSLICSLCLTFCSIASSNVSTHTSCRHPCTCNTAVVL